MSSKNKGYPWSEEENINRFNIHADRILSNIDSEFVIVADGDETISKQDTSRIFWELNFSQNHWQDFKSKFDKKGRNYNSFMEVALIYSKISLDDYMEFCEKTARLIELRNGWNKFKKTAPTILIITSGIRLLWEKIIAINEWDNTYVIGGNHLLQDKYIVDQNIKAELVMKLRRLNKKVIAFGDSRLDAQMLENSNMGCIIVNERRSPGLAERVKDLQHIYQVKMDEKPLENIPICKLNEVFDKYYLLHLLNAA